MAILDEVRLTYIASCCFMNFQCQMVKSNSFQKRQVLFTRPTFVIVEICERPESLHACAVAPDRVVLREGPEVKPIPPPHLLDPHVDSRPQARQIHG